MRYRFSVMLLEFGLGYAWSPQTVAINIGDYVQVWGKQLNDLLNPLRSNSDQRQNSLCNINAFSVGEVMRMKDMITQHEFRR